MVKNVRTQTLVLAVAALLVTTGSVQAQQYISANNSQITTVGDIASNKLKPDIYRFFGPQYGPSGLFADSEIFFIDFGPGSPFIFPLPEFSAAGHDFTGMTFEDYMLLVANSYELDNVNDYFLMFTYQNEVTAEFPDFIPNYTQVLQVHQNDFVAGGGYLPLADPTIPGPIYNPIPDDPTIPDSDPDDFTPLPDDPIIPGDDDDGSFPRPESSASDEIAASTYSLVSVVPEPASLGLMMLGAGALLARSRKR